MANFNPKPFEDWPREAQDRLMRDLDLRADGLDPILSSYERIGYNRGWADASVEALKREAMRGPLSLRSILLGLARGFLSGLGLAWLLVDLGFWR